jgi:hypothetical protein
MKIRSLKQPSFFLNEEGKIYYNIEDIKNGQVKKVETGIIRKEFFDVFIENSLDKDVYIYSIDDDFVRCCAI